MYDCRVIQIGDWCETTTTAHPACAAHRSAIVARIRCAMCSNGSPHDGEMDSTAAATSPATARRASASRRIASAPRSAARRSRSGRPRDPRRSRSRFRRRVRAGSTRSPRSHVEVHANADGPRSRALARARAPTTETPRAGRSESTRGYRPRRGELDGSRCRPRGGIIASPISACRSRGRTHHAAPPPRPCSDECAG